MAFLVAVRMNGFLIPNKNHIKKLYKVNINLSAYENFYLCHHLLKKSWAKACEKIANDLGLGCDFCRVLPFPPPVANG